MTYDARVNDGYEGPPEPGRETNRSATFDEWWATMPAASERTGLPFSASSPDAYRESYDEGMTPDEALIEDASYGE